MRSRLVAVSITLATGWGAIWAHPDGEPTTRAVQDHIAYEIDCSPVNAAPASPNDCSLILTFTFMDGETWTTSVAFRAGPGAAKRVVRLLKESCADGRGLGGPPDDPRDGRRGYCVSSSETRIAFVAYKGCRVRSLGVTSQGLPESCRPQVYKVGWTGPDPQRIGSSVPPERVHGGIQ